MSNPRLDVVARVMSGAEVKRMREAGATAIIQPEFEAGIEVIRHVLHRYGIGDREPAHITAGRREAFYRHATDG